MAGRPEDLETSVSARELVQAAELCPFALVVWDTDTFKVTIATLIGADIRAIAPSEVVEAIVGLFLTGSIDSIYSKDERICRGDGSTVPVSLWTRMIEVDGKAFEVSLAAPPDEVARVSSDSPAPWRELASVAVGFADERWHVASMSADITKITGWQPADWVGRSLIDFAHPDDIGGLLAKGEHTGVRQAFPLVRIRSAHDTWRPFRLLFAPTFGAHGIAFALVEEPQTTPDVRGRVQELEMRLRHIGAEVRAAGLLEDVNALPAMTDTPELTQLTSRQWEILSRLLRGQRVNAIAAELYLSQSTVRNHLATIFQRFGVHSQSELIELLHPREPT